MLPALCSGRATWSGRVWVGLFSTSPSVLCFAVGGLRSPWKGECKEPRDPPPHPAQALPSQGHSPRTPETPHAQPKELSPGTPGPQPTEDTTGGAAQLQPPLPPEPPERNKSPSLNWGKEESGTWEPLPLSSLDLAPVKNPSSVERKATLPEQELQQLEMGTGSHGCGPRVPGRRPGPPPGPVHLPPGGPCLQSKRPDTQTGHPLPVDSHPLRLSAELFLNSLSQPFSLEEQEQILSCLSIDSLSLSDDSEKVSWPQTLCVPLVSGLRPSNGKGRLKGITPSFRKGSPPGQGFMVSQETIHLQHTWELGNGWLVRIVGRRFGLGFF